MELQICLVCEQNYNSTSRKPLQLPHCGHTFCMACLQEALVEQKQCYAGEQAEAEYRRLEDVPECFVKFHCQTCYQSKEYGDLPRNYYYYDAVSRVYKLNYSALMAESVVAKFWVNPHAIIKYPQRNLSLDHACQQ